MSKSELPAQSVILDEIIGFLYPFILLLGFYMILHGHKYPGGGFQGGTILAALFIARYIISPESQMSSERMHMLQRIFLALILTVPCVVLFTGMLDQFPQYRTPYLQVMNILIGLQVGLELGVAILRFAFFEGVGKTWRL